MTLSLKIARALVAGVEAKQADIDVRTDANGFEIARRDLELRGPGELLGTRQTGLAQLRVADLMRDADLLPRSCARPVCRVPRSSPGPRSSRSRRAISNPSQDSRMTFRRARASAESGAR